jgi:AAA domain
LSIPACSSASTFATARPADHADIIVHNDVPRLHAWEVRLRCVFMLLWINGPFGGGKSQTARELRSRLPGSLICDPEQLGYGLHRMLPAQLRDDFQDLPAWRQGVYEVLDLVLRSFDGPVIAPMTLVEPAYFADIIGRLTDRGHDVRHFALLAEARVIERRLRERAVVHAIQRLRGQDVPPFRETFAIRKLGLCLDHLSQPEFATQLRTDDLTVPQVAEAIAASAALELSPHQGTAVGDRLRWAGRGLRHALMS